MAEAAPQARPKATGDDGIVFIVLSIISKTCRTWFHKTVCSLLSLLEHACTISSLPVPMLRQVYFDLSGSTFPHAFIAIFTKIMKNKVSGSCYSHVFIAI